MGDLSGKVILLTGASRGIGRAAAVLLAKRGAKLALVARQKPLLDSLAQELWEKHKAESTVIVADVSRQDDCERMVRETEQKFGRLDVLVNNAGVLFMEPFIGMPMDRVRQVMDTNFWSIVYSTWAAVPVMEKTGGGHIVNVGSGVSRRALPFMSIYSVSKFALAALTESLRVELASQNITFTSIYPGGVDTDMPRGVDKSRLPDGSYMRIKGIPAEKVGRAIVKAVRCRPAEIYVPGWVRLGAWLSVLWPTMADRILKTARMPHKAGKK